MNRGQGYAIFFYSLHVKSIDEDRVYHLFCQSVLHATDLLFLMIVVVVSVGEWVENDMYHRPRKWSLWLSQKSTIKTQTTKTFSNARRNNGIKTRRVWYSKKRRIKKTQEKKEVPGTSVNTGRFEIRIDSDDCININAWNWNWIGVSSRSSPWRRAWIKTSNA